MRRRLMPVVLAVLVLAGCGGGASTSSTAQHGFHTQFGLSAHSPGFGAPPTNPTLIPPLRGVVPAVSMLDSVDSFSVFSGLHYQAIAGYTSGSWPTFSEYRSHYSRVVAVMVNTSHFGERRAVRSCLDVEPGDASPSQAGGWGKAEISRGFTPCFYGSLSEMPSIRASLAGAGVPRSRVFLWDADWTYAPHIDAGYDATQWTDHYDGRNIDGTTATYKFVRYSTGKPKPPKPKAPVCFGAHRQHTATCNAVRKRLAVLGAERDRYHRYVVVSSRNLKRLHAQEKTVNARLRAELARERVLEKTLEQELHQFGYRKGG